LLRKASAAVDPGKALTLSDYEFIPPQNWQVLKNPDYFLLSQTPDQSGCMILIFAPQPSSGNLEQDAKAVFESMYRGWNYAKSGEQQYRLVKGILPAGHDYYMIEASMAATNSAGQYLLEDGVAMVVKANNQIAIIAVRHRGLLAHIDCLNKYNTWRRFFNSFKINRVSLASESLPNDKERIIGIWSQSESGAISEYTFAANGHYAFGGSLGSTWTHSDTNNEYLYIRTHSFQGDGNYSIVDATLTLQSRLNNSTERARYRFEQVNHAGTGWKDRLYLLKQDSQGQFEVCYEKKT